MAKHLMRALRMDLRWRFCALFISGEQICISPLPLSGASRGFVAGLPLRRLILPKSAMTACCGMRARCSACNTREGSVTARRSLLLRRGSERLHHSVVEGCDLPAPVLLGKHAQAKLLVGRQVNT